MIRSAANEIRRLRGEGRLLAGISSEVARLFPDLTLADFAKAAAVVESEDMGAAVAAAEDAYADDAFGALVVQPPAHPAATIYALGYGFSEQDLVAGTAAAERMFGLDAVGKAVALDREAATYHLCLLSDDACCPNSVAQLGRLIREAGGAE